ncbi:hypothetical protein PFISCL1PPCAC_2617, partial [Pristionchus fissidentatus]
SVAMAPSFMGSVCPDKLGKYPMVTVPIPNSRISLFFIFRKEYTGMKKFFRYMCAKCFQQQRKTHERNPATFRVQMMSASLCKFFEDPTEPSAHICSYKTVAEPRRKTIIEPYCSREEQRRSMRNKMHQDTMIGRTSGREDVQAGCSRDQYDGEGPSKSYEEMAPSSHQSPISRLDNLFAYETYIFNADGVLWNSRGAVPGAARIVNDLISKEKRVLIVTNNSTKTTHQFLEKTRDLGMYGLAELGGIVSPLTVMVDFFKKNLQFVKGGVFVIGTQSIVDTLVKEFGARCFGIGPDVISSSEIPHSVDLQTGVSAVIVGFDVHFSYAKLMKAANYLSNPDCGFFIMNEEGSFSMDGGDSLIAPGTGVISASIRSSVHPRQPTIFGRPSETMREYLKEIIGGDSRRSLLFAEGHSDGLRLGKDLGVNTCRVDMGIKVEKTKESSNVIPDFSLRCDPIQGYTREVYGFR